MGLPRSFRIGASLIAPLSLRCAAVGRYRFNFRLAAERECPDFPPLVRRRSADRRATVWTAESIIPRREIIDNAARCFSIESGTFAERRKNKLTPEFENVEGTFFSDDGERRALRRPKNLRERLGERVERRRVARGWSQKELAERATVSPDTIRAIENGERYPDLETLRLILIALGCRRWDELLPPLY